MQDLTAYIEIEKENHPWASPAILKRIVKDNLKADPNCYSEEEESEEEESMEESMDEENMEGVDPNDPMLSITITKTGKKGMGQDPFPKDQYGD